MGVVFRQSVKSTIATFVGALLGALVIYLSTHYLPKQQFGFRSTLTNYAVVGGQIMLFGLHNTIAVYIHRYASSDKRSAVLITLTFLIPFVLMTLASLGYFLNKESIIALFQVDDMPFIREYFLWLPVFTILFAYQVILENYLISQLKVAKTTFIREVLLRFLNIVLIILYGWNLISFSTLIYGTVLVYLVPITLLLLLSLRTDQFQFSLNYKVFSVAEAKELFSFTWYHSLLGVTITLMGMLDALMLATFSKNGLKSVPIYTISVFIISFLLIPYRAMLNSTFALLAQSFKDGDMKKTADIFMRSSLNIAIASLGMCVLIVSNLENAIKIIPEGYEEVLPVVVILCIGRMADMLTGMNDQVLSMSRFYRLNFVISLLLVLMLVAFNWFLIPKYDAVGAAWATTLSLIVYNALKLFIVKKKLHMQPLTARTLRVVVSAAVALLVGYYLPFFGNPYLDTVIRSGAVLTTYLALLLFFKPSEDLNQYLQSVKKNKRLF